MLKEHWFKPVVSAAAVDGLARLWHLQARWWRSFMMTSSNGNIFRVTSHLCGVPGEFPTQRTVTRSSDVYFDLRPNKRLSKHSWGWWFETSSRPLWRHHNVGPIFVKDNLWTVLIWLLQRPWVWYMYLTVLDRVIPCMFTNVDSFHDESRI